MTLTSFRTQESELRSSFTSAGVRRMNFSTLQPSLALYLFVALVKARRTAFGPVLGATVLMPVQPYSMSTISARVSTHGVWRFSFLLRFFLSFSLTRGITVPSPIFYHPFARLSACALRHASPRVLRRATLRSILA